MIKLKNYFIAAGLSLSAMSVMAANPVKGTENDNWYNLDPGTDKTMGISTEKAYKELLAGKKSKKVIVAVIDSGVDIEHEDLKDIIWTNPGEIPGNGIDDDNNGYIDDIHGWNFIGNADGENINPATLEVTRLYRQFRDQFGDMSEDSVKMSGEVDFELYKRVMDTYASEIDEIEGTLGYIEDVKSDYLKYDSVLISLTGKKNYTLKDVKSLKVEKKTLADSAKKGMFSWMKRGVDYAAIADAMEYYSDRAENHYNPDFYPREILADDVYSWNSDYGNNDVEGEDPSHGTMVSGVIGAVRTNNIGVLGIADNVEIMSIRTVPDGDEWDKDVANAIKYAIDNGAEVINMSFGKAFSPQKAFVDSIIKLVDENNVLLVHAAGNDNKNIDFEYNYPNKYTEDKELLANNYITIGASTKSSKKKALVASFSNYGKQNVDVFAPGHQMLLCAPDSEYEVASGTSFAAPVVTGVAALIKSYYPELTAGEIKDIIRESSVKKDYKVTLPGTYGKNKEVVQFSSLSNTGGLVNVYNALVMAEERTK